MIWTKNWGFWNFQNFENFYKMRQYLARQSLAEDCIWNLGGPKKGRFGGQNLKFFKWNFGTFIYNKSSPTESREKMQT